MSLDMSTSKPHGLDLLSNQTGTSLNVELLMTEDVLGCLMMVTYSLERNSYQVTFPASLFSDLVFLCLALIEQITSDIL